jgi:DNA-binding CsgD family transcriptional regulator/PAS domain-containing protein
MGPSPPAASAGDSFEELVGLVYEGPLQDKPWRSFLPALRRAMDAQVVSLVLRPPATGDRGVILNCQRSDSDEDDLADPSDWEAMTYQEQFFAIDPFVNLPPGKVVTQQELIPDAELLVSDYYLNYLKPIGLFHILGVDTVEPDGMQARLRIARRPDEPAFEDAHKQFCEQLLPHLQRAIQIHARLSRTESERDLYADAVDHLAVATLVLDERGRVLNTNAVAGALLAEDDGMNLTDQRLHLQDRATDSQLQAMVEAAVAAQRAGTTGMVRALRVPRPSGLKDYGLVLRPVPLAEWAEGQSSPSVAVFISDPAQGEGPGFEPSEVSRQLLQELFQLTPAEASLALRLARGLSLAEVSAQQNISQHTARAQLKSIFSKTGVTRQAELVRLVLKSVASLA